MSGDGDAPCGRWLNDRGPERGREAPTGGKTDSLASNDFTYYFTFFSKFFASFHHGTCSLSVSHQYLALDGIYHLFGLQSQANRLVEDRPYGLTRGTDGILTLYDALFQKTYTYTAGERQLDRLQFDMRNMLILGLSSSRFTRRY